MRGISDIPSRDGGANGGLGVSHLALVHAAAAATCACRPASWSGSFASPPLQTGADPGFPQSAAPGGLEAIAILKQAPPCVSLLRQAVDCSRPPPPQLAGICDRGGPRAGSDFVIVRHRRAGRRTLPPQFHLSCHQHELFQNHFSNRNTEGVS